MREALDAWIGHDARVHRCGPVAAPPATRTRTRIIAAPEIDLVAAEGPTRLQQKLDRGEFVVSVEIDPPKGLNPAKALEGARLLQEAGVDFINVADSPMARVRMSALTLCYLIQHQVGVETILHLTTRDRSLMGLQSELLGAHAVGVRNIIALTGDPPSLGDYPDSSAVYDVDSIGLIRVLERLNAGADSAGASIGRPAGVHHRLRRRSHPRRSGAGGGAAAGQAGGRRARRDDAADLRPEPRGGVSWRCTASTACRCRSWPASCPCRARKHAEFLHNEVPGITLTRRGARADAAGRAGRPPRRGEDGAGAAARCSPHVQGVYLMPSFGRYEVAAEVLQVLEREPAGVYELRVITSVFWVVARGATSGSGSAL